MRRVPPSHREDLRASIEAAVSEAEPWRFEFPFDAPPGETLWLRGQSQPERHRDELLYHGVLLDVTERKETERDLRSTKRRLESTLESLDEAVLVINPSERRIVTCNAAVESIFGYDKAELIGESTEMLHVDREAYERFGEISEKVLGDEGRFTGEYRMWRKDGRLIMTEHVVTPLQGKEWLQGVVSVVRDVTERREAARQLRLQASALEARICADPTQALELVSTNPEQFDLILADQVMPNLTGLDLARTLRTQGIDLPIVITSGYSADLTSENVEAAGVQAMLWKPFQTKELIDVLQEIGLA